MDDSVELSRDLLECLDDISAPKKSRPGRKKGRRRSNIKQARGESPEEILDPQRSRKPLRKFGNYNGKGGSGTRNHRSVDLRRLRKGDEENCVLI